MIFIFSLSLSLSLSDDYAKGYMNSVNIKNVRQQF